MILKIKAANERAIESWRFFDGVEGLHHSIYYFDELSVAPLPEGVQEAYFTHPPGGNIPIDNSDIPHPRTKMIEMCFHSDSTGPIHVYCNTEAYLLNDNGRTIERLI